MFDKDEYLELKRYGVTDKAIAAKIGVGIKKLRRYKTEVGVDRLYRRANQFGITEEHYRTADGNKIPRLTVYARVANYEWCIEDAITIPVIPKNKRRMAKGVLKCQTPSITENE